MRSRRLRTLARYDGAFRRRLWAITRPERGQRTALRQVRMWLGLPQVGIVEL